MGGGGATEGSGIVTMEYLFFIFYMVRNAIYKWNCDEKQSN